MRVLIDSNVLISAARSGTGKPYAAFLKATLPPNQALRAAVAAHVDVILTGDGDFLNAGIQHPKPMRPAEFLASKI